jgi:hypothetical protein
MVLELLEGLCYGLYYYDIMTGMTDSVRSCAPPNMQGARGLHMDSAWFPHVYSVDVCGCTIGVL